MGALPCDLFYDVSQYLSPKDLASARAACHLFRQQVSTLVDHIQLLLQPSDAGWVHELHEALSAFPSASRLRLLCPAGDPETGSWTSETARLLASRLKSLAIEGPPHASFNWQLLRLFSGQKLTRMHLHRVSGALHSDGLGNPFEGLTSLTHLSVDSCWPRVPLSALSCLSNLQDLTFRCDMWSDNEVAGLSSLTTLSSLHLHGAQMSHQVQRTTLQSLITSLPRLAHLQLGRLRPCQAYAVLEAAAGTPSLSLCVEGDAPDVLRLAQRCSPGNMRGLQLSVKGVLPEGFWPAVGHLTGLEALEMELRSYRRTRAAAAGAAAAAAPAAAAAALPPLQVAHLCGLARLHTLAVTSAPIGRDEVQQAVPGAHAAALVAACTQLSELRLDCLDPRDARALFARLPGAPALRTLHLGCVPLPGAPTPADAPAAAAAAAAQAPPAAAQPLPPPQQHLEQPAAAAQGAADPTEAVTADVQPAVLTLSHLPSRLQRATLLGSESLYLHLAHPPERSSPERSSPEGTVAATFPHLRSLHAAGYALQGHHTLPTIAACMPALQHLALLQPPPALKPAAAQTAAPATATALPAQRAAQHAARHASGRAVAAPSPPSHAAEHASNHAAEHASNHAAEHASNHAAEHASNHAAERASNHAAHHASTPAAAPPSLAPLLSLHQLCRLHLDQGATLMTPRVARWLAQRPWAALVLKGSVQGGREEEGQEEGAEGLLVKGGGAELLREAAAFV